MKIRTYKATHKRYSDIDDPECRALLASIDNSIADIRANRPVLYQAMEYEAGCKDCFEPHFVAWEGPTASAVAMRHFDATDHRVWVVEKRITVFGEN